MKGFMTGELLHDRYKIGDLIRTKGMAQTYKATDEHTGAAVAVKVAVAEHAFKSLGWEYGIGSVLNHPNLLEYLEFCQLVGGACIVTELIEGDQFLSALASPTDGTPSPEALRAFSQLQTVLEYLHQNRLVHANLSPQHLLTMPAGILKVLDLGHCIDLKGSTRFWHEAPHGTIAYMSPEHLSGDIVEESDYFVVGILLAEYLLSENLFLHGNYVDATRAIFTVGRGDIIQSKIMLSQQMSQILKSLLAARPNERRQGWVELRKIAEHGV